MEEFVYFDALCDNFKCQNQKIAVIFHVKIY